MYCIYLQASINVYYTNPLYEGGNNVCRPALSNPCIGAGFPNPAEDYMDRGLDLNQYLIQHPAATFYCRVNGDSMTGTGNI